MEARRRMTPVPSIVSILPDKMGGMVSVLANLLEYRARDEFRYEVVLTHNRHDIATRSTVPLRADRVTVFDYDLPVENVHAVVRRLNRAIGPGRGVIVCNDALELLMVSALDTGRTVFQIVHGNYDYYYDLAAAHAPYVHAFIAISRTVHDKLRERLPHRRDSVFWLPYGAAMSRAARQPVAGPLRLLFVGRLDEAKGVLLLPEIDRQLKSRQVPVRWTIVGDGPAAASLQAQWLNRADRRWIPSATPADVVTVCEQHDIFVLPSRAEGLPVAMVEAMSAGVVPVATDLPSLRDLVDGRSTGLRVPRCEPVAFVEAIESLANDRARLDAMSVAARSAVRGRFDGATRAAAYQELFSRWRELYRPWPGTAAHGSRLDKPWIPNTVVRFIRSAIRASR
jgi:glycosyltransferase involved in cell wall biosynthesis